MNKIINLFWSSAHLKFYRTSATKSTFRTQNDTDKAHFRCAVDKKVLFALESNEIHAVIDSYLDEVEWLKKILDTYF